MKKLNNNLPVDRRGLVDCMKVRKITTAEQPRDGEVVLSVKVIDEGVIGCYYRVSPCGVCGTLAYPTANPGCEHQKAVSNFVNDGTGRAIVGEYGVTQ